MYMQSCAKMAHSRTMTRHARTAYKAHTGPEVWRSSVRNALRAGRHQAADLEMWMTAPYVSLTCCTIQTCGCCRWRKPSARCCALKKSPRGGNYHFVSYFCTVSSGLSGWNIHNRGHLHRLWARDVPARQLDIRLYWMSWWSDHSWKGIKGSGGLCL